MSQKVVAAEVDLERKVLQVYGLLKELIRESGAPPCVTCNSRKALAAVWQIVNDLDLVHEELFEYGV